MKRGSLRDPSPAPRARGGAAEPRPRGGRGARAVMLAPRARGAPGVQLCLHTCGKRARRLIGGGQELLPGHAGHRTGAPAAGVSRSRALRVCLLWGMGNGKAGGGEKKPAGSRADSQAPHLGWFSTLNVEMSLCCHVLRKGVVSL